MNVSAQTLQKILARKIKGYAFMSYPRDGWATAQEYRAHHEQELIKDNALMGSTEFREKYRAYIY